MSKPHPPEADDKPLDEPARSMPVEGRLTDRLTRRAIRHGQQLLIDLDCDIDLAILALSLWAAAGNNWTDAERRAWLHSLADGLVLDDDDAAHVRRLLHDTLRQQRRDAH